MKNKIHTVYSKVSNTAPLERVLQAVHEMKFLHEVQTNVTDTHLSFFRYSSYVVVGLKEGATFCLNFAVGFHAHLTLSRLFVHSPLRECSICETIERHKRADNLISPTLAVGILGINRHMYMNVCSSLVL